MNHQRRWIVVGAAAVVAVAAGAGAPIALIAGRRPGAVRPDSWNTRPRPHSAYTKGWVGHRG